MDLPAEPELGTGREARLVVVAGGDVGRRYRVEETVRFGRSAEADVPLDGADVSRFHAQLSPLGDGRFAIEDLGSRNGTFVDGERVESRELESEARIQLGSTAILLLTWVDPDEERALEANKMQTIGRIGAGIAHDFNNLVGVMLSSLEYLKGIGADRPLGDPEVQECHADLELAAGRAAGLASRLTGTVRRPSTERELVDVAEVSTEAAQLALRTFPRTIEVRHQVSRGAYVHGDPAALHQLVLNLCINARDAMAQGGKLDVEVYLARAEELGDAPVLSPTRHVCVTVRDTGCGMDDETLQHMFEPLFTTKAGEDGTGLGLAVVRDIARAHGGAVAADSRPGEGTTFRVYLPAHDRPTGRLTTRTKRKTMDGFGDTSPRVLLVEDEEAVARSTARLLKRMGCTVTIAGGGPQALEIYDNEQKGFDIVLLDLDMPVMTGEQCQERLRQLDPDVCVLFLSGHHAPERERRVCEEGALGFLHKPCDGTSLQAAIERALRQRPRLRSETS